tara:strand:- start:183 stop:578 length:396 start_codon:yes stop_codon:yes gene_type:complete
MIEVRNIEISELIKLVYKLIAETTIQMGHRTDGNTMVTLSKAFANDLIRENKFKRLYFEDIRTAFMTGLRSEDKDFISIPTFYKWVREQKKLIDYATYEVNTLNVPKEQVLLYREYPKALINKVKQINKLK